MGLPLNIGTAAKLSPTESPPLLVPLTPTLPPRLSSSYSDVCGCSAKALSWMPRIFSFLSPVSMLNTALYQAQKAVCSAASPLAAGLLALLH